MEIFADNTEIDIYIRVAMDMDAGIKIKAG